MGTLQTTLLLKMGCNIVPNSKNLIGDSNRATYNIASTLAQEVLQRGTTRYTTAFIGSVNAPQLVSCRAVLDHYVKLIQRSKARHLTAVLAL